MHVQHGSGVIEIETDVLRQRVSSAERIVIDVGTGDARWAYRLARAHPTWLVIGIDPARDRLREMATRIGRKPAKGGVDNLWLVATDVESAPDDLRGIAHEVHVLLPWGTLLRGAVLGDLDLLGAVRSLACAGGTVELVLGADIWDEPVPLDIRQLPVVDLTYVHEVLTERYAAAGLAIEDAEVLPEAAWRAIPSSWARRLAHGRREPTFVRIEARAS